MVAESQVLLKNRESTLPLSGSRDVHVEGRGYDPGDHAVPRPPKTLAETVAREPINVGDANYGPLYPFGYGVRTG